MPANFEQCNADLAAPGRGSAAVTPNDSTDLTINPTRGLWIGGSGNVKLTFADGTTDTITGVVGGTLLPFQVTRVWSTSTTATSISAIY